MKTDKRIVKTKTNIKNAFLELAKDKKLDDITVSELTSHAKVNRSTFYLHYDSVLGVLADLETEIAEKIASNFDTFDINDIYGSTYKILAKLSALLDGIPNLKKCIVSSENSTNIIAKLKNILTEKATYAVLSDFPTLKEDDIKYPITFAAAGIIESYLKWVRSGDSKPMEVLIAEVGKITVRILEDIATADKKTAQTHDSIIY